MAFTFSTHAQEVIAHRGFWQTEGSAQNSLAALVKADSIGCYGSEFDVWLSKDGIPVVYHDKLAGLRRVEKQSARKLTSRKLKNGEQLPTLEAYLETGKSVHCKLILELKKYSSAARETEAVQKILALVEKYALSDRMKYISFSLHAVKEFIRLSPPPGTPVYYLKGDLSPSQLQQEGCNGIDYSVSVLKKRPEWIEEAHKLDMKVNVWTVNSKEDMQFMIKNGVDYITTNDPLLLQHLLKE
ncbi:MAG: glycerophosphodiester phosphodiesterase [Bacteroides sp.]|nr:glycerophosphodiester phosphodiesterase [Bacteroides sp.]